MLKVQVSYSVSVEALNDIGLVNDRRDGREGCWWRRVGRGIRWLWNIQLVGGVFGTEQWSTGQHGSTATAR